MYNDILKVRGVFYPIWTVWVRSKANSVWFCSRLRLWTLSRSEMHFPINVPLSSGYSRDWKNDVLPCAWIIPLHFKWLYVSVTESVSLMGVLQLQFGNSLLSACFWAAGIQPSFPKDHIPFQTAAVCVCIYSVTDSTDCSSHRSTMTRQ